MKREKKRRERESNGGRKGKELTLPYQTAIDFALVLIKMP